MHTKNTAYEPQSLYSCLKLTNPQSLPWKTVLQGAIKVAHDGFIGELFSMYETHSLTNDSQRRYGKIRGKDGQKSSQLFCRRSIMGRRFHQKRYVMSPNP